MWIYLSGSCPMAKSYPENFFSRLSKEPKAAVASQIAKDVDRTNFSDENGNLVALNAANKELLVAILYAYSNYDPKLGYCQGTNYLVGIIILTVKSKRAAFWIFFQLMTNFGWRDLFSDKHTRLKKLTVLLLDRIEQKLPYLWDHLVKVNVNK